MKNLNEKIIRENIILSKFPESSVLIIEHAKLHGRVTIGEMSELTKISRNTLKVHFRDLVKNGQLLTHGKGRGTWYSLK